MTIGTSEKSGGEQSGAPTVQPTPLDLRDRPNKRDDKNALAADEEREDESRS
jgi:hypothetical protein